MCVYVCRCVCLCVCLHVCAIQYTLRMCVIACVLYCVGGIFLYPELAVNKSICQRVFISAAMYAALIDLMLVNLLFIHLFNLFNSPFI